MGVIETSQYVNSPVVTVSFQILDSDWCLLEKSKIWRRIENFLAETGKGSSRMSRKEKKALLVKG